MAELTQGRYLVLMVDDSEDDCLLIKMAVGQAQRLRFIGSIADGEELMAYLQGTGQYADRGQFPLPDLLLLDLMMPRKDGFEVLQWLRGQSFDAMVVVVLSGSEQPEDIKRALELGADYYHTKAASAAKRQELIQRLEEYLVSRGESEEAR